jgi:hypothetical protein
MDDLRSGDTSAGAPPLLAPRGAAREFGMDDRLEIPDDFDAPLPPDVLSDFE